VPARDPRRRRHWSRGLLALGLLALVGLVVTFQAAVHWIVERELTRTLDARVRIDRLRISPVTGTLAATGLSVYDKSSRQPLLRIQDVEIQVLPGALWYREILITHLRLVQPEAWLALTPGGISWLSFGVPGDNSPSRLAVSFRNVEVRGGRIHIADRRRTPEHREVVEAIAVSLRDLSTRDDRREAHPVLTLSGKWRGMSVSAEGWVAPFAQRRAFHLPMRIRRADLGQVAGILPPGLAPPGLAGTAEVAVDVQGQEADGGWQVQAGLKVEARRVTARPRPGLAVQGRSLRLEGEGRWNPRVIGFSHLKLDLAGATIEIGGQLRGTVDRLVARGQGDLDHRGLLVPEMVVEVTGLSLGRAGQPPAVEVGRIAAAGGTDQRAGTARLERVSLADVRVRALRQVDGSLDVAEWLGGLGRAGVGGGESRPLTWEVLKLQIERGGLDLTDMGSGPEKSLRVTNASLRLDGATSDPAQPITFAFAASTSVAPAITLSGTWTRAPMQLAAKLVVRDADLPAVRPWLPATLPVGVPSGRASLTVQADVRSGQDGLTASGSGNLALHSIRMLSEPVGEFAAEDLEVGLTGIRAAGPGLAGLTIRAEGRVRGTTLRARMGEQTGSTAGEAAAGEIQVTLERLGLAPRQGGGRTLTARGRAVIRDLQASAPGYGVNALNVQEIRADVGSVTGNLGLGAAGEDQGLPRPAPFRLRLRSIEVDQPQVQAVRAGDGRARTPGGTGVGDLPSVRLDQLVLRNGRVGFRDETVQPAWSAEWTQVEGMIEGLETDRDVPASFRLSATESDGAQVRLHGQLRPATWSGEVHADVQNLDVLRPGPYLPDLIHRVVRGGTVSGGMDLSLRRNGQAFQVTGKGEVTFAPLELGDAKRQLTLVLANKVQVRADQFTLDPLTIRLSSIRLEEPWIAVGRDEDGILPVFRLLNELRQATGTGPTAAGAGASVTIGQLTITDGIVEIEDRAVQPRFREQVQKLQASMEGLATDGDRKAGVTLTGELGDRSTVSLKGFVLPLPTNLTVDLEGEIRDFNLYRLNPYATRVTSHRLDGGKLFTQVHYHIEQGRLEGENIVHIDQLAIGDQVEPEDRFEALVGVPLAVAVSLLQDTDGEIILRIPVHGELARPEFDLGEVIGTAVKNTLAQLIAAPFQMIGEIFTLGGKIGAIEIAPVLFSPGSWALDDAAREHLRNIAAVMRERPGMKVKLSGMAHVESDEDGLRAQKVAAEVQRIAREPGVKSPDDALDRLFLRTVGASTSRLTSEAKLARLKAAQRVTARDMEDLPDARTLSLYDYMAGVEGIERNRMFLAEGKVYRTAEGGGDWARRADFTILKP